MKAFTAHLKEIDTSIRKLIHKNLKRAEQNKMPKLWLGVQLVKLWLDSV